MVTPTLYVCQMYKLRCHSSMDSTHCMKAPAVWSLFQGVWHARNLYTICWKHSRNKEIKPSWNQKSLWWYHTQTVLQKSSQTVFAVQVQFLPLVFSFPVADLGRSWNPETNLEITSEIMWFQNLVLFSCVRPLTLISFDCTLTGMCNRQHYGL